MNGESFSEISHQDAVGFLGSLRLENFNLSNLSPKYFVRGQIILELKSSEAVSEDDPSNLDYR